MSPRYWSAALLFVAVPAALGSIWLGRSRPPQLACRDEITPAIERSRDAWLSGAEPLLVAAALVVLATIMLVSRWRRGAAPSTATIVAGTAALVLVVISPFVVVAFAIFAVILIAAAHFWYVSAPLVAIVVAAHIVRVRPADRPVAAVAALGWCSLVLAVGAVATYVLYSGAGPYCFD